MLRKFLQTAAGSRRPGADPSPPLTAGRWRTFWHTQFTDHGLLRYAWTNFHEVAPGVYRSNHPHPARLRAYRDMGIRAVLNLRGANDSPSYLQEQQACAALGLELVSIKFTARGLPRRERLMELFAAFDSIQRPFIMHCKSGADRAGLASVLYLLDQNVPLERARYHLSTKFLHLKWTKTGVLDAFLDVYADRLAKGPIPVRHWVRDEYDPDDVRQLFARRRGMTP